MSSGAFPGTRALPGASRLPPRCERRANLLLQPRQRARANRRGDACCLRDAVLAWLPPASRCLAVPETACEPQPLPRAVNRSFVAPLLDLKEQGLIHHMIGHVKYATSLLKPSGRGWTGHPVPSPPQDLVGTPAPAAVPLCGGRSGPSITPLQGLCYPPRAVLWRGRAESPVRASIRPAWPRHPVHDVCRGPLGAGGRLPPPDGCWSGCVIPLCGEAGGKLW